MRRHGEYPLKVMIVKYYISNFTPETYLTNPWRQSKRILHQKEELKWLHSCKYTELCTKQSLYLCYSLDCPSWCRFSLSPSVHTQTGRHCSLQLLQPTHTYPDPGTPTKKGLVHSIYVLLINYHQPLKNGMICSSSIAGYIFNTSFAECLCWHDCISIRYSVHNRWKSQFIIISSTTMIMDKMHFVQSA